MELRQLIAGPLIATVEADALSAQKYLDYLMHMAFDRYDPRTGETGKLRTMTFTYDEQDLNGPQRRSVSIPIVTLVPLPLLQVREADFDFGVKILDALSEQVEERFPIRGGGSTPERQNPGAFRMRALLAPWPAAGTSGGELQQSLAANMKVRVRMRQADMPAGLSSLLHLTANNLKMNEIIDYEEGGDDDGR